MHDPIPRPVPMLCAPGIHATVIAEAFQAAVVKSEEILTSVAIPVDLSERE